MAARTRTSFQIVNREQAVKLLARTAGLWFGDGCMMLFIIRVKNMSAAEASEMFRIKQTARVG